MMPGLQVRFATSGVTSDSFSAPGPFHDHCTSGSNASGGAFIVQSPNPLPSSFALHLSIIPPVSPPVSVPFIGRSNFVPIVSLPDDDVTPAEVASLVAIVSLADPDPEADVPEPVGSAVSLAPLLPFVAVADADTDVPVPPSVAVPPPLSPQAARQSKRTEEQGKVRILGSLPATARASPRPVAPRRNSREAAHATAHVSTDTVWIPTRSPSTVSPITNISIAPSSIPPESGPIRNVLISTRCASSTARSAVYCCARITS